MIRRHRNRTALERLKNNPQRQELAERAQRSDVNGPAGTWCDYCTPRKLYHPTDHPAQGNGEVAG